MQMCLSYVSLTYFVTWLQEKEQGNGIETYFFFFLTNFSFEKSLKNYELILLQPLFTRHF